ncbi:class A beta-lactamase [Mycobacterium kubicae]|uniref:class A beta-lactamase n=1 Tax=Mycobacterium kubicae TaxID=120959 RepID=UPI001642261A|nr:class A beta-lactamase [Mycobacterium kubicae]QNI06423.1 class A beta-lactamase [Mycobacterium kubicae]
MLTGWPRAVAAPSDRIDELESQYHAFAGVYAQDLDSGHTVTHRADDPFAMCSTFKAYAAGRVLHKVQRGELDLDQATFIDPNELQPNSPATAPHAGQSMPLAQLCAAALQRSDNTAANLLLQAIGGPPAITEFARFIGDDRTRLDRWEVELNTAIPGDPRDTSTPRALGAGIQNLLAGTVLAPPQRRQLETWMRGNVTSTMRAGLPPGWTTADKTGSGDYGSTNDVGIAYGPNGQRVLLAIMTRSQAADPDADALQPLIADVTRAVLPALAG